MNTKEGLAYILAYVIAAGAVMAAPLASDIRAALVACIIGVLVLDTLDIMRKVYSKLDERERRHQLESERAASFTAIGGMLVLMAYTAISAPPTEMPGRVLPLAGILVAMAAAKGVTLIYMEREK